MYWKQVEYFLLICPHHFDYPPHFSMLFIYNFQQLYFCVAKVCEFRIKDVIFFHIRYILSLFPRCHYSLFGVGGGGGGGGGGPRGGESGIQSRAEAMEEEE